jgi:phytoene desaturase
MHHKLPKKAVVIGSGIAGMAVATRLSLQGFEVEVFEASDHPGGKLDMMVQDGFKFDAGPSLFTQPENIEELFVEAGENMADFFAYSKVDVVCSYFFENGKKLQTHANRKLLLQAFEKELNEDPANINNYLDRAESLYKNIGHIFLDYPLHKKETWLNKHIFSALGSLRWSYLFSSLHRYNKSNFKTAEANQLFNRFATYNGSNPYKAPAMLSVIPHLEQNQGTYYPQGGMISITNALYKLALKKGVVFHFNQKVTEILHDSNRINGVIVAGKKINANVVVSNGDVYYTFKELLGIPSKVSSIQKMERSSSAIIFYWGIENNFPELGLHNILFSEKYQEEFEHLFDKKSIINDPTIYINITSKMESGMAPEGSENWFVMINAPTDTGQDWKELVAQTKANVIQKINRLLKTDLEPLIKTEITLDPRGISQKTNTYQGSLYGSSSNSKLAAFFRPSNEYAKIKGMYFCGGTVHPGGGIPLCLKSAKIASQLIRKNHAHA